MEGSKKGPSVAMVVLVSCVIAITLVDMLLFAIVTARQRGLIHLRREVMSKLEASAMRNADSENKDADEPKKKKKKSRPADDLPGGGAEDAVLYLLERNIGPTLTDLAIAQGWTTDDERVLTLVKGITDPLVGDVLEELLTQALS